MLHLNKHFHDVAYNKNLKLAPENPFSCFFLLKILVMKLSLVQLNQFNPKKLELIEFLPRLQKLNWWGSLPHWISILNLLTNVTLKRILYKIYSMTKINSTGIMNCKHCSNKFKHLLQKSYSDNTQYQPSLLCYCRLFFKWCPIPNE